MKTRIRTETDLLTDGSPVYNVVLDGESPATGIGTSRLRIGCADRLTADRIVKYLHGLIDTRNVTYIV